MTDKIFMLISGVAFDAPFLAIGLIFLHYCWRRAAWKRKRRRGVRCVGFCPSACAMGFALLFVQVFYQPTVSNVIEVMRDEGVDDQGDPESLAKQLSRQLRQIRRGELVGDLILRL
jgi:hypothetical protein